jgi:hypothetical protein
VSGDAPGIPAVLVAARDLRHLPLAPAESLQSLQRLSNPDATRHPLT